jgi:lipopolysaccharide export system permease protein
MTYIQKFLVLETLKMLAATLAGSLFLLTLGGGLKEAIRNSLPLHIVLQLFPFLVLEMLRFTVPGCLLFAVCSVYGRLSASHELTALKSVGINPLRVVWPVLVLAYGLSVGTFVVYDVCAGWARPNLKQTLAESIDDVAYALLKSDLSFSSDKLSIVVQGVVGKRLLQPVIMIGGDDQDAEMVLTAEEAQLRFDDTDKTLQLVCYNATLDVAGQWTLDYPDRFEHSVQLKDANLGHENTLSPAALRLGSIAGQVERQRRMVRELKQRTAAAEGGEAENLRRQLAHHRTRLHRLLAEPNRRMANGFGCLCFALVGIPVAMWWRSADNVSVFFVCFLPILLIYYPLLVAGETLARAGWFPALSVWLADVVLLALGLVLFHRTLKR